MKNNRSNLSNLLITAALMGISMSIFADGGAAAGGLNDIVNNVTGTFQSLGKLMAAGAYIAGFALTIAAIFKFKQHKDNPQQVQMGVPITMLLVGVALIFLPNIIQPAGQSIFGSDAKVGGVTGDGFTSIVGGK